MKEEGRGGVKKERGRSEVVKGIRRKMKKGRGRKIVEGRRGKKDIIGIGDEVM